MASLEDYKKYFASLQTNPDKAQETLLTVTEFLEEDLAKEKALLEELGKANERIAELQETNQKLFLRVQEPQQNQEQSYRESADNALNEIMLGYGFGSKKEGK